MKAIFTFLFLNVWILGFSQKGFVSVGEINRKVSDTASQYYYERLVYRFNFDPMTLDSLEMKHLYYGKNLNTNISGLISNRFKFLDSFKSGDCKNTILEGKKILAVDPANLEVLGLMLNCYSQEESYVQDYGLRGVQFRRIIDTILQNGRQENNEKKFTVMNIPDEYIIANILQIDLQGYKRTSEFNEKGALDTWKSGKNKLHFLVIYDREQFK